jgi:transcriptional regulator with XRE-family HTH domain
MTLYEEVGERIRELRTENGYTGEKLGHLLGISKANVSQLESGKVKQDLEVLLKISKLFNTNLLWLAKGEGVKYDSVQTVEVIETNTLKISERDRYEQRIDQLLFTVKILSEKLGKHRGVFIHSALRNVTQSKIFTMATS